MRQGGRGKRNRDGCGVKVDFKRDVVIKIRATRTLGPMRWMWAKRVEGDRRRIYMR